MDSASSSESSSSRSLSPVPVKLREKGKRKEKIKEKSHNDKSESQGPNWAFEPPYKYSQVKDVHDSEEWDWDAFHENKDLEIWLIRVPDGVEPRHLEKASIRDLSGSSKHSKVGTVKSKRGEYDIFEYRDDGPPIGGEEIKNISCLLPRRGKKDELRLAPRPIARRLVVTSHGAVATPIDRDTAIEHTNPTRFSYSKSMLKHKFMPYGSHFPMPPEDVAMDVDEVQPAPSESQPEEKHSEGSKNKGKRKKRVEEASSPKKSKKMKIRE